MLKYRPSVSQFNINIFCKCQNASRISFRPKGKDTFFNVVGSSLETNLFGYRTENVSDEALPEEKKKRTGEIKTIPKITKELRTRKD